MERMKEKLTESFYSNSDKISFIIAKNYFFLFSYTKKHMKIVPTLSKRFYLLW